MNRGSRMSGKKNSEKALGRKEREYQSRRGEILSAALKLFSQKGYHQTSMSEVAKAAEFSIGSLYGFFKNKEDLFFTLLNEEIEEIERQVRPAMGKAAGAKGKLNALATTLFDYFESRWEAFHIFAMNQKEFDWALRADLGDMIRVRQFQFVEVMAGLIQQGIAEGVFRPLRPEQMALAFIGLINGSIIMWIESGRNYSLRERASEILDIFYKGAEKI